MLLSALVSLQGMRYAHAAAEVELLLLLQPAVNEGASHLNAAFCLLCSDRHVCQIKANCMQSLLCTLCTLLIWHVSSGVSMPEYMPDHTRAESKSHMAQQQLAEG